MIMIGVYTYVIRMLWENVENIHCIDQSERSPLFRASGMLPELTISYLKLIRWRQAKVFNALNRFAKRFGAPNLFVNQFDWSDPLAHGHPESIKYAILTSGNGT